MTRQRLLHRLEPKSSVAAAPSAWMLLLSAATVTGLAHIPLPGHCSNIQRIGWGEVVCALCLCDLLAAMGHLQFLVTCSSRTHLSDRRVLMYFRLPRRMVLCHWCCAATPKKLQCKVLLHFQLPQQLTEDIWLLPEKCLMVCLAPL
jgi:hypothetical protein